MLDKAGLAAGAGGAAPVRDSWSPTGCSPTRPRREALDGSGGLVQPLPQALAATRRPAKRG